MWLNGQNMEAMYNSSQICPKLHALSLSVPSTEILGESSVLVERDSALTLTCVLRSDDGANSNDHYHNSNYNSNSRRLEWYKDGKVSS